MKRLDRKSGATSRGGGNSRRSYRNDVRSNRSEWNDGSCEWHSISQHRRPAKRRIRATRPFKLSVYYTDAEIRINRGATYLLCGHRRIKTTLRRSSRYSSSYFTLSICTFDREYEPRRTIGILIDRFPSNLKIVSSDFLQIFDASLSYIK